MGPDNELNPGPTPDYPFHGPSPASRAWPRMVPPLPRHQPMQHPPPVAYDAPTPIDPPKSPRRRELRPPPPGQQRAIAIWGTRQVPAAPAVAAIRQYCRSLTPELIDRALAIIRDPETPPAVQMAGILGIVDRGGAAPRKSDDTPETPGPDLATLIRGVAPADLAALVELARAVREARMEAQGIVETTATEG